MMCTRPLLPLSLLLFRPLVRPPISPLLIWQLGFHNASQAHASGVPSLLPCAHCRWALPPCVALTRFEDPNLRRNQWNRPVRVEHYQTKG
ncbi:hypothetical protein F4775DRAFT_545167 [Biscogniauxia sp. FL1348]|nr:hypothetical protein F4775DRAFT_545167 [Biscogniauxia sp. FL1348]